MTFTPSWLTGALALCVSHACWAASESSASATLRFDAIDLITGGAAEFSYQPSHYLTTEFAYSVPQGGWRVDTGSSVEGPGFESFSAPFTSPVPGRSGQVTVSADHASLHAVAATDSGGSYEALLRLRAGSLYTSNPSLGIITLAPHSSLKISVDVSLLAAALNPLSPTNAESARAAAYVSIIRESTGYRYSDSLVAEASARGDRTETISGYQRYFDEDLGWWRWKLATTDVFHPATEESVSKNQTFMSVLVNDSDIVQYAYLGVELSVKGSGRGPFAAPVPEAGTLTMALAGSLLAVAAVGRRRMAHAPVEAPAGQTPAIR